MTGIWPYYPPLPQGRERAKPSASRRENKLEKRTMKNSTLCQTSKRKKQDFRLRESFQVRFSLRGRVASLFARAFSSLCARSRDTLGLLLVFERRVRAIGAPSSEKKESLSFSFSCFARLVLIPLASIRPLPPSFPFHLCFSSFSSAATQKFWPRVTTELQFKGN